MTPKDRIVQFRLSESEFKILQEESKKAGFLTVSEYIRYMTLGDGTKIRDIDEKLDTILKKLNKK